MSMFATGRARTPRARETGSRFGPKFGLEFALRAVRAAAMVCAAGLALGGAGALAAERVALLIGNADYQYTSRLGSPVQDVDAMRRTLEALGFEVAALSDADRRSMGRAISDFAERAAAADTAVLYYSGHGMEIGGRNFLVPVDAELRREADAGFEAIPLDAVIDATGEARRLSIVIVDACRNNLFPSVAKSGPKGFRPVRAANGQLIAFAAAAGEVAYDGGGALSPFTQALTEALADGSSLARDVRQLFGGLGPRVSQLAGGPQEPFTHSAGFGLETVTLMGAAAAQTPGAATPPASDRTPVGLFAPPVETAAETAASKTAFDYAKGIGSAVAFRDVAEIYPHTFWGRQAAREAEALERAAAEGRTTTGPAPEAATAAVQTPRGAALLDIAQIDAAAGAWLTPAIESGAEDFAGYYVVAPSILENRHAATDDNFSGFGYIAPGSIVSADATSDSMRGEARYQFALAYGCAAIDPIWIKPDELAYLGAEWSDDYRRIADGVDVGKVPGSTKWRRGPQGGLRACR